MSNLFVSTRARLFVCLFVRLDVFVKRTCGFTLLVRGIYTYILLFFSVSFFVRMKSLPPIGRVVCFF